MRKRKEKLDFESKSDSQKEKFSIYKEERGGHFWKGKKDKRKVTFRKKVDLDKDSARLTVRG